MVVGGSKTEEKCRTNRPGECGDRLACEAGQRFNDSGRKNDHGEGGVWRRVRLVVACGAADGVKLVWLGSGFNDEFNGGGGEA